EKVTAVGDYIFRACFIDPFQGYVMAKFATETLKLKKAAILRDVRNDYSVGLAKVFNDNFTKMGGQIVDNESYSSGDVDFKAQLPNIKGAAPNALYVPGYYTDVGLIARQAREVGLTVPLLGGDGWASEKRNATKPAVVLRVGKGGKYEFSGRIQPEGVKETNPAEAPRATPDSPKKTEGNTAPNAAPGTIPTPTQTPPVGATTGAQSAANTGQPQGVPAGEHSKK